MPEMWKPDSQSSNKTCTRTRFEIWLTTTLGATWATKPLPLPWFEKSILNTGGPVWLLPDPSTDLPQLAFRRQWLWPLYQEQLWCRQPKLMRRQSFDSQVHASRWHTAERFHPQSQVQACRTRSNLGSSYSFRSSPWVTIWTFPWRTLWLPT